MTVRSPDGTTWRVGRRWWPWSPRQREIDRPDAADLIDLGGADDVLGAVVVVFTVIVLVVILFTVVLPFIALAVELILLLLAFFWGIAARLVLRRPWTIQARASDGRELTWRAKGFRRSGRVRDAVAEALARGEADPRPAEALTA